MNPSSLNGECVAAPKRPKGKALRRKSRLLHWDDLPDYLKVRT